MCSRSRCSSVRSSDCLMALPRFSARDQAHVGDPVAKGSGEDPLLVVPVGGDQDGGVVGARLGPLGRVLLDRIAEAPSQVGEGLGDRGGADHAQDRRGQARLQEDLERPSAETGVLDGHSAVLDRRLGLGAAREDPQQHRVSGLERAQRVQAHGRLGAGAPDEAVDRAVRADLRGVAGPDARRALRPHDGRLDEGCPACRGPGFHQHRCVGSNNSNHLAFKGTPGSSSAHGRRRPALSPRAEPPRACRWSGRRGSRRGRRASRTRRTPERRPPGS